MKNPLLICSFLLIWLFTITKLNAQTYTDTTAENCIAVTGGQVTLTFSNPPPASGPVTLTFYYRGDLNGTATNPEKFDFFDEGSNLLGTSNFVSIQCDPNKDTIQVIIASTLWNSWLADGQVDILADADATVSSTLSTCAAFGGSCAQASVVYTSTSGNCANSFTGFLIDSISGTAARINWTPGTGNSSFFLEYGPTGFTPGTGTSITGTYPGPQPPVNISGLSAQTSYDLYFGEICNAGADSVFFATPVTFSTTKLCAPISNFVVSNVLANSVDLSWSHPGGANSFTILYNGLTTTATSSPFTLTGLSPSTNYDISVVADCGATNGLSDTIGPVNITTPIQGPVGVNCITGTAGLVFQDDFEVQGGWTGINGGSGNWGYNSGGTGSSNTGPNSAHSNSSYIYYEASGGQPQAIAVSPRIDLTTANDSAELSFWVHGFGADIGTLIVGASTSPTGPFNPVFTSTGAIQAAQGDPWQQVGVRLDSYVGQDVYLQFDYTDGGSGFTGDLAIDLIEVRSCLLCPFPSFPSLTALTDSNATIEFDDPSGTAWDLEWGPVGFTQGTGSVTSVTSDSVSFGPLAANTCYDIYVRSNCTATSNGTSGWVGPLQFCTECSSFNAPYAQNFDGTTAPELDNCWTPLAFNPSATNFELQTDAFRNNSPSNSMEIHNASATSGFLGIASPRFADLDDQKRLEFFVYDEDGQFGGSDLIIGVMTDLSDETTFTGLDTITEAEMDDDLWDFFVIDLTNNPITSGGGYVVFQHGMNSTFDNIHIDDFEYKQIPSCQPPLITSLGTLAITSGGATVNWGTGSQGIKTYIAWGNVGFVPGVSAQLGIDSVAGTVDQYTITGLSPQTTYEFYVQDSCATDGLSPWIGPFTFTTLCLPITAPITETFDNTPWVAGTGFNMAGDAIDPCWDRTERVATTTYSWNVYSGSTSSFATGPSGDNTTGTGNYMATEGSNSATGTAEMLTPLVDVSTLNTPFFEFFYHRYGTTIPDFLVEINDGTGWDTLFYSDVQTQSAESDPYLDFGADISAYRDTVQVRFTAFGNGCCSSDMAFDDVSFKEAPSCPRVINLTTGTVVDTAATLSWVGNSSTNNYEFWIGPQGFFQGTQVTGGSRTVVTGSNITVDTLMPNTCYDFLVRGICAPGDTGIWVGPVTFCTPCAPFTAPYVEDFDNVTANIAGDFGNCWNGLPANTSTFSFRSNTGTTTSGSTGPNGDATTGNGVYLYTEASGAAAAAIAELYSPLIDLSGQTNPEVKFAYHMYGSGIDSLNLDINDGSGWTNLMFIQGQQQTANADPWRDTSVNIASYSGLIQVRFRVTHGSGFTGDVALDDVEIGEPILNDAEVNALLVAGGCGDSATTVDLVFTNKGANAITSMPVSVAVSGTQTTTLNATYTGSLATDQSDTVRVGTVNTYNGDSLQFFGSLNLPADQVGLNDTLSEGPAEFTPFEPIGFDTVACASDDSVFLRALDIGVQYAWFGSNNPTDTVPLATGDSVAFAAATALSTYYLQYQSGVSGSLTTGFAGGNGQAGNSFDVLPTNAISLTGMDINVPGTVDVSVYYRLGTAVGNMTSISSWTLHESFTGVTGAGATSPANLQFTAPLNLPGGQVSALLVVVTNGPNLAYTTGTTLGAVLASNSDLIIYEGYGLGWNGDISGTFNPRYFNGTLYYGGGGCSEIRTPVNVSIGTDTTEAAFTATGPQPTFTFDATASVNADSYQWDFGDGNSGTGVTTTHTYANNGVYNVVLTTLDSTGCVSQDTATTVIDVNVGIAENALGQSLNVFPNPATDVVNVSFETVNSGDVSLRLLDAQGRVVMTHAEKANGEQHTATLSVKALSRGMYILEVQSGDLKARRSISVR
jgi:hypothetical protein